MLFADTSLCCSTLKSIRLPLLDLVLRNEFIFVVLHLFGHLGAKSRLVGCGTLCILELLIESFLSHIGGGLLVGGHFAESLHSFLLVTIHFLSDVVFEYFLDETSELANSLVEQGKQLVGLETQFASKLVNRFVLETHACECGRLDVGKRESACGEDQEM